MSPYPPPIVPMSSPDLTDAERQAVLNVLNTPHLSMGGQIEAFEQTFCNYTGWRHAIGVNSGTAGLHLCVRAAGIQAGDWVITTPFSFVASANALLFENAVPVFVDVEERSGNINPALVAEAARDLMQGGKAAQRWLPRRGLHTHPNGQLKAILAVDVFGQPADYDLLRVIADQYGLRLIEDSCEALGAEYKGRKAGTLGDYGVFAFYPNKQITTGEGGMIVTDDDSAGQLMRALRNQGRAPGDTWLQHTYLGYNYRLDEMSAALGIAQMNRLEELLGKRQRVADWYHQRLVQIAGVEPPALEETTTRPSWFVYVIRLARGIDRAAVAQRLAERGIPVRPYFLPIHLQPYMVERFGYQPGDYPVTEDLGERGLALPFSGVMDEAQVERVCDTLRQVL
ncbi:predicted pyridoxal phosphate-dependent enzyme [Bellilinea caldifistulae]|uniref:Polysaccharide biosynthesis protein n=1 Tax=Bellilinea caldifistulae TaxID=360411 RepID=A0A0P6XI74_9CHLR|nr:DegT/DnrJ/EryC1/StrS family aminotransferase [Bellilinea caldifistulae]KPL75197.1 polysaccharide biosynthesis protein [Bellilinea caldifistulae]GAP09324.1 predicted pyridoxal phosphate-dependent enzyme [Bellilinea caldifistulae]